MLAIESSRRTADDHRVIHFSMEGTFYRAYEWSAWLAVRFIGELKVTKRFSKAVNGEIVFVGFPVGSVQKFTPEGIMPMIFEDGKLLTMVIPAERFGQDETVEKLKEEFLSWKNGVEDTPKKSQQDGGGVKSSPLQEGKPSRLTDIVHKILAYPIEQKSPMECMSFLAEIKKKIAEFV